jgi:hypothetical protein
MDVITEAAAGDSEQTPIAVITAEGKGKLSLTDAARTLALARQPKEQQAAGEQRVDGAMRQAEQESPLRPSCCGGLVRRSARRAGAADRHVGGGLSRRPAHGVDPARQDRRDRRQILSEYTLVARNEKSSGSVFDLTTS